MNGLNSFATTDPFKIKHPTLMERTRSASLIIYVDHKDGVHIAKNRYGATGKVCTKDLVNILCHTLAEQIFDGRMILFQEGMKTKLIKVINKVIKEG